jgi:hypothetical protein
MRFFYHVHVWAAIGLPVIAAAASPPSPPSPLVVPPSQYW